MKDKLKIKRPKVALVRLKSRSGFSDKLYRFRTDSKEHYSDEILIVETVNGPVVGKFEKYGWCLNPRKLKPVVQSGIEVSLSPLEEFNKLIKESSHVNIFK